jgi:Domain of unknown function (DUF4333)
MKSTTASAAGIERWTSAFNMQYPVDSHREAVTVPTQAGPTRARDPKHFGPNNVRREAWVETFKPGRKGDEMYKPREDVEPFRRKQASNRAIGYSRHLRRTRLYGLATAILVVPSLSGCGESAPTLKTVTVERAVAASIMAQHHLYATVRCPSNVPRKAGDVFTCTASLNVGTYPVSVTETNSKGHVEYQNQNPLATLNITKVEQAIKQSISSQRHLNSTVTCPAEVIQKKEIVFTCTAVVNGKSYPFEVTEVDNAGHVRYVGRR